MAPRRRASRNPVVRVGLFVRGCSAAARRAAVRQRRSEPAVGRCHRAAADVRVRWAYHSPTRIDRTRYLMSDCCNDKACEIEALKAKQSSTLKAVLGINATMFAVELAAGIAAGSVALVADSLDMLGDALVYGFSLYAVTRGLREKA